ncbi:MAG: hypothetical protein DRP74_04945 [Candidatus Omnitrophota bacterium]|nr:MAG: hypothetical protein DRP74_04945 [Candidatus Omnitrophota bacterium]
MLEDWLKYLGKNTYIKALKKAALPHFKELTEYHFSVTNPLFWILCLLLMLLLARIWGLKKSFGFCLILSLVLLTTTIIENFMLDILSQSPILSALPKVISLIVLSMISIYYLFVRKSWE